MFKADSENLRTRGLNRSENYNRKRKYEEKEKEKRKRKKTTSVSQVSAASTEPSTGLFRDIDKADQIFHSDDEA
jgi:hypothetical protein